MPNKPAYDKFHDVLFKNFDEQEHLTPAERLQLKRIRAIFDISMENPTTTDRELRDYLINEHNISMRQAYYDINSVRVLLGNMRNAGKEWVRYTVNETLKQAIEMAKKMGNKGIKHMIAAANTMGKFNMLDKHDGEAIPWDEIIPVTIEPVNDPTVLNVKPLENKSEAIRKLYEKYKGEIEIEDGDYEDA